MLRALYHGAACLYFRWELGALHPASLEAQRFQLRHALHRAALDKWLTEGA